MGRTDERHGATERRARRTRDACGAFGDGGDARGNPTAIGRASVGASRDREGRAARDPVARRVGKVGLPERKSRVDARRDRRTRTSRGTPTPTRRARRVEG